MKKINTTRPTPKLSRDDTPPPLFRYVPLESQISENGVSLRFKPNAVIPFGRNVDAEATVLTQAKLGTRVRKYEVLLTEYRRLETIARCDRQELAQAEANLANADETGAIDASYMVEAAQLTLAESGQNLARIYPRVKAAYQDAVAEVNSLTSVETTAAVAQAKALAVAAEAEALALIGPAIENWARVKLAHARLLRCQWPTAPKVLGELPAIPAAMPEMIGAR